MFIFLGVCGLLFALLVGANDAKAGGFVVFVAVVSILFLLVGFGIKKPSSQLSTEQVAWDDMWLCARCGHQWKA
jgi:uncharacterized oligopeptide transporter (OPT) family protein